MSNQKLANLEEAKRSLFENRMTGGAQFCHGSDSREGFRSRATTPSAAIRAKKGYSGTPPIDLTNSQDGVVEKRGAKRTVVDVLGGGSNELILV